MPGRRAPSRQRATLASQPTVSRFENAVRTTALHRPRRELADAVIERHRRRLHGRARRITLDLDPTDDPTHGAQQLSFFNGHDDTWCDIKAEVVQLAGREPRDNPRFVITNL